MKKILLGNLIALGMLFYNQTLSMAPQLQLPSLLKIDLSLINETKDNFILMEDNKLLAKIKANTSTKNIKVPITVLTTSAISTTFTAPQLILINPITNNRFFIKIIINKTPSRIILQAHLSKEMTSKITIGTKLADIVTHEPLTSLVESIDNPNLQDTYKFELILKGDELADSELDYTASMIQ